VTAVYHRQRYAIASFGLALRLLDETEQARKSVIVDTSQIPTLLVTPL
jgi:hypothetical protein